MNRLVNERLLALERRVAELDFILRSVAGVLQAAEIDRCLGDDLSVRALVRDVRRALGAEPWT